MKLKYLIPLFLIPLIAGATTFKIHKHGKCRKHKIRVALVDTGLDLKDPRFKDLLCKTGHKNFVFGEPINDINGHGTHLAGLIKKYAGNSDYCLLIYKYYQEEASGWTNMVRENQALQAAVDDKVDIVNLSGGGSLFNEAESLIIKSHPEVTFVVAAGNEGKDLDIPGNDFFPASLFYKNIIPVENIDENGVLSPHSNYSRRIKAKEIGEHVLSTLPYGQEGYLSGTSMSTATFTGKLVDKRSKSCETK